MDYRIEVRKHETGGGVMAFGLIQLGLSASSLDDADTVSLVIDRLAGNYYYKNIASSHDPGEIFNTDISGGLPAVIIKSLVHSQPGVIELLPACPRHMRKGRIHGVLCRGQVKVVDMAWEPGKIDMTLESAKDQTLEIRLPFEPERGGVGERGGFDRVESRKQHRKGRAVGGEIRDDQDCSNSSVLVSTAFRPPVILNSFQDPSLRSLDAESPESSSGSA